MTKEIKYHYLYKIVNIINKKVYIGQTINPIKRWAGHKRQSNSIKSKQVISKAIHKYGIDNFIFEVIAACKSYEDANFLEEYLIIQYNCLISNGNGYNIALGGETAPKSDEWKAAMKKWRDSLSIEEKEKIKQQQREATIKQIATQGHPALGRKWTDEQKQLHSIRQKENPIEYTEEVRQRMSEAHIGNTDSEETKQKKSEKARLAWQNRISYEGIKCSASGCCIEGKAKYKIIDGVRYCNKHGLRMLRYGRLDTIKQ